MRFTDQMVDVINDAVEEKKALKPYTTGAVVGIGTNLKNSIGGTAVYIDNWQICTVDQVSRLIEELQMIQEAAKEMAGVIL